MALKGGCRSRHAGGSRLPRPAQHQRRSPPAQESPPLPAHAQRQPISPDKPISQRRVFSKTRIRSHRARPGRPGLGSHTAGSKGSTFPWQAWRAHTQAGTRMRAHTGRYTRAHTGHTRAGTHVHTYAGTHRQHTRVHTGRHTYAHTGGHTQAGAHARRGPTWCRASRPGQSPLSGAQPGPGSSEPLRSPAGKSAARSREARLGAASGPGRDSGLRSREPDRRSL